MEIKKEVTVEFTGIDVRYLSLLFKSFLPDACSRLAYDQKELEEAKEWACKIVQHRDLWSTNDLVKKDHTYSEHTILITKWGDVETVGVVYTMKPLENDKPVTQEEIDKLRPVSKCSFIASRVFKF